MHGGDLLLLFVPRDLPCSSSHVALLCFPCLHKVREASSVLNSGSASLSSVSRNGLKYSDWLGRTENQCKVLCLSNESCSAHICMHTTVKCHNSSGNYGNMCKLGDSACSWPVVHAQLPKLQMQSQIKPINAPQQCKNWLFSITGWFLDKAVINLKLWIFFVMVRKLLGGEGVY